MAYVRRSRPEPALTPVSTSYFGWLTTKLLGDRLAVCFSTSSAMASRSRKASPLFFSSTTCATGWSLVLNHLAPRLGVDLKPFIPKLAMKVCTVAPLPTGMQRSGFQSSFFFIGDSLVAIRWRNFQHFKQRRVAH
jgi:hypothetical protein